MHSGPLAGTYQVFFAHYVSYVAQHFNVATMAMLFERSILKPKPVDIFLLISCIASYTNLVKKLLKHMLKVYNFGV